MKYRRAFRIGLVLTGMAVPALAAELEHERLESEKARLKSLSHQEGRPDPATEAANPVRD